MSTTTDPAQTATTIAPAPGPPVVRVRVPQRTLRSELRAMTSGFSACVLVTARNAGFSFPSSSTTGK